MPNRRAASARPSGVPGTPHDAGPTWNTWAASSENRISTGSRAAGLGVPAAQTRRGHEEVEQVVLTSGGVDEHEPARARPGERRLGRERHQHGGHRGVDRVAAGAEHGRAGLGRERMAGSYDS
ncbi:MAG: hypothetical protein WKF31_03430 [Thermoleophilaceae bacterium]